MCTESTTTTRSNILFISPWETEGGIATYSKYLVPNLREYSDVQVFSWDFDSFFKRGMGAPLITKSFIKKLRKADIAHVQYTPSLYFISLPVLILLSRFTKTKIVLTQHERFGNLPLSSLVFIYHQILYFFVDQIIVHTNHRKEIVWSVHNSRVTVIEHGIINRPDFNRSPSTIDTILFPGTIRPGKGHHIVINSLKEYDDISLRIVGSVANEEYSNNLQEISDDQGISNRIQWITDFIPEEQLFKELREADLVVLPYETDTAMSGILCHCISWKVPTIISDVPAFRHMISYDDIFLSERSSQSIAKKIQEYKSNPEKQRQVINRFEKISSDNSWKTISEDTTQAYIDLLS